MGEVGEFGDLLGLASLALADGFENPALDVLLVGVELLGGAEVFALACLDERGHPLSMVGGNHEVEEVHGDLIGVGEVLDVFALELELGELHFGSGDDADILRPLLALIEDGLGK